MADADADADTAGLFSKLCLLRSSWYLTASRGPVVSSMRGQLLGAQVDPVPQPGLVRVFESENCTVPRLYRRFRTSSVGWLTAILRCLENLVQEGHDPILSS